MTRSKAFGIVLSSLLVACVAASESHHGKSAAPSDEVQVMTIDRVIWSDDASLDDGIREGLGDKGPLLLGHVVEWESFQALKSFTAAADKVFFLDAPGRTPVRATVGTGGITSASGRTRYVVLHPAFDMAQVLDGVSYSLRPQNHVSGYRWVVGPGLSVQR